jgi:DoxX-like family
MATNASISSTSTIMLWTGRILSALVILFLLFDGTIKVMELDVAMQTTAQLGYPVSVVFGLGVLTLVIAVLYAIPRTAVLGTIFLTGLLGGAIATHLRVGSPIFTHMLFGLYLGLAAWGGLILRDDRLRATLLP